jgi:hypothetical protein
MDLPKVVPTPPSSAAPQQPDQPINVMDLPKANHDGEVLNNVVDGHGAAAHHASGGYDHATALPGASFTGTHHDAPETSAATDPGHTGATNHTGADAWCWATGRSPDSVVMGTRPNWYRRQILRPIA